MAALGCRDGLSVRGGDAANKQVCLPKKVESGLTVARRVRPRRVNPDHSDRQGGVFVQVCAIIRG
ncbi:hypothetical protein FRACA_400024 [Frankia canadensis]|uniref:Uncharacterized protein n=1 Tax=Frankia canadensis TaxID=1836972 RepID=A0A2I2KWQ2_9ACTN|nr:hypothetical protein FRACA_400024 [Frankia canadensis]SOU57381.1 hypothetical protein FRACA_400024 [Frankia canadensis]